MLSWPAPHQQPSDMFEERRVPRRRAWRPPPVGKRFSGKYRPAAKCRPEVCRLRANWPIILRRRQTSHKGLPGPGAWLEGEATAIRFSICKGVDDPELMI